MRDYCEKSKWNGQKKQRRFYSGKKKKHTIKSQAIVDEKSEKIICTVFSHGKRHVFRLLKESKLPIHPKIQVLTDSGYQGLQKIHLNTQMPKKKSKRNLFF